MNRTISILILAALPAIIVSATQAIPAVAWRDAGIDKQQLEADWLRSDTLRFDYFINGRRWECQTDHKQSKTWTTQSILFWKTFILTNKIFNSAASCVRTVPIQSLWNKIGWEYKRGSA